MRVLIADDDVVLRHTLRTHLEKWEYEVVECADGAAAWQAMREPSPPPVAIMDWNMPGVDGPALCQEVRETPGLSGMYIILLTSNASKQDMITGLESGADDYIVKPFDWDELKDRLRIRDDRDYWLQIEQYLSEHSDARFSHGICPECLFEHADE